MHSRLTKLNQLPELTMRMQARKQTRTLAGVQACKAAREKASNLAKKEAGKQTTTSTMTKQAIYNKERQPS